MTKDELLVLSNKYYELLCELYGGTWNVMYTLNDEWMDLGFIDVISNNIQQLMNDYNNGLMSISTALSIQASMISEYHNSPFGRDYASMKDIIKIDNRYLSNNECNFVQQFNFSRYDDDLSAASDIILSNIFKSIIIQDNKLVQTHLDDIERILIQYLKQGDMIILDRWVDENYDIFEMCVRCFNPIYNKTHSRYLDSITVNGNLIPIGYTFLMSRDCTRFIISRQDAIKIEIPLNFQEYSIIDIDNILVTKKFNVFFDLDKIIPFTLHNSCDNIIETLEISEVENE